MPTNLYSHQVSPHVGEHNVHVYEQARLALYTRPFRPLIETHVNSGNVALNACNLYNTSVCNCVFVCWCMCARGIMKESMCIYEKCVYI